jgi:hypothetical protein
MDPVSLVFGLLYAGIGTLLLRGASDFSFASVWPILLVLAGLALLFSAVRSSDRRRVEIPSENDRTGSTTENRPGAERTSEGGT